MLDAMRETISVTTLQVLKRDPSAVDAERWVPRLVDEIERLRMCLKREEQRAGLTPRGAPHSSLRARLRPGSG